MKKGERESEGSLSWFSWVFQAGADSSEGAEISSLPPLW